MRSWTAWLIGKVWPRAFRPPTPRSITTGCPGCPKGWPGFSIPAEQPSQVFPDAAVADSRQIRQIAGYMKRKIR
jgi:hypothetical protein